MTGTHPDMKTHGKELTNTMARVSTRDNDGVSYHYKLLARRGTGVVQAARLTSAEPAHKAAPAVIATSPRGLNTGGTSSNV